MSWFEVGGKGKDHHLEADHDSLFLRLGGVAPSLNLQSDSGRVRKE